MTLEILTPEQKIFSGDVYGVQLPGIGGSFEVLDKHAPMVSALKDGRLNILKSKTQTTSYTIKSGFMISFLIRFGVDDRTFSGSSPST